jgi:8-oxo-dGTP diphosphatase
MARMPVLAAGGIVLRREDPARVAVVRLRKRNEWVLPKGKLDDGETPRAAAEREVLEETGHDVSVHEFLGTLVYESGGRSKVVHYWRMEADGDQVHELMDDIKAVDWLPLGDAVVRLSRSYERAFLENVGPLAVQAAAHARATRRSKAKRPAPLKRRSRPAVAPQPLPVASEAPPQQGELVPQELAPVDSIEPVAVTGEAVEPAMPSLLPTEPGMAPPEMPAVRALQSSAATRDEPANAMQRVQDWLRRVIRPDRAAASGR